MALNSFTVFTDHRDLEGLESRELDLTPNNRILRNTEFLLSFPLKIKYLEKVKNFLEDWFSLIHKLRKSFKLLRSMSPNIISFFASLINKLSSWLNLITH